MGFKRQILFVFLAWMYICTLNAQTAGSNRVKFFEPANQYHKSRFIGVSSTLATGYAGSLIALNQYWYKDYPKSKFHFFNDNAEWLQMDKAGHVFNGYFLSNWCIGLYKWAGLNNTQASWLGGVSGNLLLTTIEILDGFSSKWGASPGDLLANTIGSGLAISQSLIWQEQRIQMKISVWPKSYPTDLKERAGNLYGNTVAETVLKDYNALTVWVSVNPYSFMKKESRFPKWLNISAGYSAEGLYGGFENKWCSEPGVSPENCNGAEIIDRTDIRRYRQFLLSVDVDFTKIKTRSPFLKTLFGVLNIIKIPAPAIEFNELGQVKFHPVYF
jgi:Predicted periplasmic lipoprotein (DUF2279)